MNDQKDVIPLTTIIYNCFARDGTWCLSPYPNHPKGCPNFKKGCTKKRPAFTELKALYNWYAIIETFDLKSHAEQKKKEHPHWTERQCRNPLYWQGTVRKKLKEKVERFRVNNNQPSIVLDIPEANGIDVFETMAKEGIILERTPDIVKKVMIVGRTS